MFNCHLCNSNNVEIVVNILHDEIVYTMVHCKRCDLLQCVEQYHLVSPDYVCLNPVDINAERIWCQGKHKINAFNKWNKYLKKFKIMQDYPLRLLDIGCGTGGFMDYINNDNIDIYGFDASRTQADIARNKYSYVRQSKSCSEYIKELGVPKMMFDVVTMWDVLEHIRNPIEFLADVRKAIRPGGYLYIATPNGMAKMFKYKIYKSLSLNVDPYYEFMPWEHVFYYSPNSLKYLLEKSGFNVIDIGSVPCYQRPFSLFELFRRGIYLSTRVFPSVAFQIYSWACVVK